MPLYKARGTGNVISVKLNGIEVLKTLWICAADTDEGWIDAYVTIQAPNGERSITMTDWIPDPDKPGAQKRHPLIQRLTGKVEVILGD